MNERRLVAVWRRYGPVLVAMLLALALTTQTQAQNGGGDRIALVIGNADYRLGALKNPVNDARDVAEKLRGLGFEVILKENLSFRELVMALQGFTERARDKRVRMLYYAGHGIQIKGRNYLVPVDATVQSEDELVHRSADVNELLDRMSEARDRVNLVILDACRSNPFVGNNVAMASDGRRLRTRGERGAASGLNRIHAPSGTLVAYATAPGAVAQDNKLEKNSIYTKHLLRNMDVPNQTIEQMFKQVRNAVSADTQFSQVPWESSSLVGEFCFKPGAGGRCGS